MWQIIFANDEDDDFIRNLNDEVIDEINAEFIQVIKTFDNVDRSVCCTSAILPVTSYDVEGQKLSIHYHIDNDEKLIRITSVELE